MYKQEEYRARTVRVFIFVILVGFIGYGGYISLNNTEVPYVSNEAAPFVVERTGETFLERIDHGYELQLSPDWYVYAVGMDMMRVQDYAEPEPGYGGSPGCGVALYSVTSTILAEINEIQSFCDVDCRMEVGDQDDWTVVRRIGGFVGTGQPTYMQEVTDGEVLGLGFYCIEESFIQQILSNVRIITSS